MRTRVSALLVCLLATAIAKAQTQPGPTAPDVSQEAYVFEHLSEAVRFENDGSGVRDVRAVVRIQSQAAVRDFGQLTLVIQPRTRTSRSTTFGSARPMDRLSTRLPRRPMTLRRKRFDPRPCTATTASGISRLWDLRPGVTLEYHVVTTVKPLAAGEFWYEHSFIDSAAVLDRSLEINIPDAREAKVKSPDRKYTTRKEEP